MRVRFASWNLRSDLLPRRNRQDLMARNSAHFHALSIGTTRSFQDFRARTPVGGMIPEFLNSKTCRNPVKFFLQNAKRSMGDADFVRVARPLNDAQFRRNL